MSDFIIRNATVKDVPFLVETIIEAEKSGTGLLSYSAIFGLSEEEARKYIAAMFLEEIDGCELSISSFMLAEKNDQVVGAIAAWIEELDGIPSAILKGNLLNYILPNECISKAFKINPVLQELHLECTTETMQLGVVYVSTEARGMNLVDRLIEQQVLRLHKIKPNIRQMYVQVFANNTKAIHAYEKANFKIIKVKESSNNEILRYLPSNKKILMKKEF
jgi:ribosomal protein S18 acetylase RimI-like enzyme